MQSYDAVQCSDYRDDAVIMLLSCCLAQMLSQMRQFVAVIVGLNVGIVVGLDAGMDVGIDVGLDVAIDVGVEVGLYVFINVGQNVFINAGLDVGRCWSRHWLGR